MVTPAAGAVHFLHVRPGQDASRAARRMRSPSDAARELMANGGVVPGSLAAPPATTTTTTATSRRPPRPRPPHPRRPRRPGGDTGAHARGGHPGAAGTHGRRPGHGRHRRRGPDPAAGLARVRLIERRIGLLFAVFLVMLALAGLRAGWLGVVRADALRKVAATQQTAKVTVPAERGAITDRNGIELAVSQPATTVAVTPYLIKDPAKVAAKLARPLRTPEDEILQAAHAPRHRLRLPRPPRPRHPRAARRADEDRGARVHPRAPPHLPARLPRLPADRRRRLRGHRPVGPRVLARRQAARPRRRAPPGQGRARRGDRAARDAPDQARLPDHPHDRRGDPGQGRGGARGRRRDVAPARRHGDRHGPAHRRAARARQLAARRRQQARPRPRLRAPEPRRRRDLRARLDLQAVHRRGRAGGEGGHAGDEVPARRRRSASTTARSASRTRAAP